MLSAVSCIGEKEISITVRHALIVYLAGDNNLSAEVKEKQDELLKNWSPLMGDLLVYSDDGKNAVLQRAKSVDGKNFYAEVKAFPKNTNSASKEHFKNVLELCRENTAATSFGFVIFSHGTGWQPDLSRSGMDGTQNTRALIMDGNEFMEFHDFLSCIPDKMFEYMVFDMCYMGGAEVMYELRNKTKYVISSPAEILSPGFTMMYRNDLDLLFKAGKYALKNDAGNCEYNLSEFTKRFFAYHDGKKGLWRSAVISLVKTAETDNLAMLYKKLSARKKIFAGDGIHTYDRYTYFDMYFDLKDVMYKMSENEEERAEIDSSVSKAVLLNLYTKSFIGKPVISCCGLSVYLPQLPVSSSQSSQKERYNRRYEETEWYKTTANL